SVATPITLNASLPATVNINALTLAPSSATVVVLDLGTKALDVNSGGILRSSVNTAAYTIQNGTVTAGASGTAADLFFAVNNAVANATTVSATIVDNGGGPVALVKSGVGGLTLTANNSYSGGTYVNGGTLTLNTPSANATSVYAVPGSLTINTGGTVNLL